MVPHCAPRLVDVVGDLEALLPAGFGPYWTTSIYRTPEEDAALGASGIHATEPHRAWDVDIPDKMFQVEADIIANEVNRRWVYDPARPSLEVVVSKLHGTGTHFHLQVHPNTRRVRC